MRTTISSVKQHDPNDVAAQSKRSKQDLGKFAIRETPSKGRGVFAKENIKKGEFLMIYDGELITSSEGEYREKHEHSCFRFFFNDHQRIRKCVDASKEPDEGLTLGRLVNHGGEKEQNAHIKVLHIDASPTLCLFALRDITVDEEILYGVPERDLPWNKQSDIHVPSGIGGNLKNDVDVPTMPTPRIDGALDKDFADGDVDGNPGAAAGDLGIGENSHDGASSSDSSANDIDCVFFPPVMFKDKLGKKRVYNKHQACYFCSKLVTKISKHLLNVHGKTKEVAKIAAMKVGSRERARAFEILRNRGNYNHNKMVHEVNQGELILVRRPVDEECENSDYGPCPDCLGFYNKADLWKHLHYFCIAKEGVETSNAQKSNRDVKLESALLLDEFSAASPLVKTVLSGMRQDSTAMVVQNDPMIIQLGNAHARRTVGMDSQRRRHYVSQEMRLVGRFLVNLQTISQSCASLDDFISPEHFDTIVEGVRVTAGQIEHEDMTYETESPSLALKLGHSLSKLAAIKRCRALSINDTKMEKMAETFLKMKDAEWAEQVSSEVLKTMYNRKHDKPIELPDSEDVKTFASFLQENIKSTTQSLKHQATVTNFRKCSDFVLARLTTFNKRRAGEMEQLSLASYTSRPDWDTASIGDIKKFLSPLERKLMDELDMVYTLGKRGRRVPILIPSEAKQAMDQLVSCRSVCGVPTDNSYFFARPGCLSNLRACDCLRQLAEEAKLKKPHLIRSTKVRKYTATVSQILNLKDSQLDWLADHLGHIVQVHRDFYRPSAPTVELTKVAKLLMAVDSGNIGQFVGKSLDEIQLEDIYIPHADSDDDEPQESSSTVAKKRRAEAPQVNSTGTGHQSHRQIASHTQQPCESSSTVVKKRRTEAPQVNSTGTGHQPHRQRDISQNSRRLWTKKETTAVWKELHLFIKQEKIPGKLDCEACIMQSDPVLNERSWRDIKYKVKTIITQLKRDKDK